MIFPFMYHVMSKPAAEGLMSAVIVADCPGSNVAEGAAVSVTVGLALTVSSAPSDGTGVVQVGFHSNARYRLPSIPAVTEFTARAFVVAPAMLVYDVPPSVLICH